VQDIIEMDQLRYCV